MTVASKAADMACSCFSTIIALHDFFAGWYRGDAVDLAVMEDALADDFRIVTPNAEVRTRAEIVGPVRAARSTRPDAEIRVVDRGCQRVRGLHLATYEEHQRLGGTSNSRVSTAIISLIDGRWRWHHVHESSMS